MILRFKTITFIYSVEIKNSILWKYEGHIHSRNLNCYSKKWYFKKAEIKPEIIYQKGRNPDRRCLQNAFNVLKLGIDVPLGRKNEVSLEEDTIQTEMNGDWRSCTRIEISNVSSISLFTVRLIKAPETRIGNSASLNFRKTVEYPWKGKIKRTKTSWTSCERTVKQSKRRKFHGIPWLY